MTGQALPANARAGPERVKFPVDPSWSARQLADEAHAFAKKLYQAHPEVLELQDLFLKYSASETALWPLLTPEEQAELRDIPLVVLPTGDFNVRIHAAPSGKGRVILFDQCILMELLDFFSALPGQRCPAYAACILQGALRKTTGMRPSVAAWGEAPLRDFKERMERGATEVPYSVSMLFGLPWCVDFLLAHEFGHHALRHFDDAPPTRRKTNPELELAADAWALNVIARLPVFELSSWLLSIELMFWYLDLIEFFHTTLRVLEGVSPPLEDHPPEIVRAERLSRLGEARFLAALDEAGNLPQPLFNNLQDRQTLWGWMKHLKVFTRALAACYHHEPERTVSLHEAVRAGEQDVETYEAELKAIIQKHRLGSRAVTVKWVLQRLKSKLF